MFFDFFSKKEPENKKSSSKVIRPSSQRSDIGFKKKLTSPSKTGETKNSPQPKSGSALPIQFKIPEFVFSPIYAHAVNPEKERDYKKIRLIFFGIFFLLLFLFLAWLLPPIVMRSTAKRFSSHDHHDRAAAWLKTALWFRPFNSGRYRYEMGREYRLSKDYGAALTVFNKILEDDPKSGNVLSEIGKIHLETGEEDQALRFFEESVKYTPNNLETRRWIANQAYQNQNFEDSCFHYEKIVESGEATADEWNRLGMAYAQTGNLDGAEKALATALEKDKTIQNSHQLLAEIYLTKKKFELAVKEYEMELSLSPSDIYLKGSVVDACQKAGDDAFERGFYDQALSYYNKGISYQTTREGDLEYSVAKLHASQKNKDLFLTHLQKAVALTPSLKKEARKDPQFSNYTRSYAFQMITR